VPLPPRLGKAMAMDTARAKTLPTVFLVGFMGAGKSSVGRALGQSLNCAFEDLDDRIEGREGRSVAEIFRASGEAEFRRVERAALRELLQELSGGEAKIVGLGGGAFVQTENAAQMEAAGAVTVFLDAPVEELWRRCVEQAEEQGLKRPLLQSVEQFRALWASRRGSYLQAALRVETGGRSIAAIVEEISNAIRARNLQLQEEG
jgi:shikimate kinase